MFENVLRMKDRDNDKNVQTRVCYCLDVARVCDLKFQWISVQIEIVVRLYNSLCKKKIHQHEMEYF